MNMNIWRIAGIIAVSCVIGMTVLVIGFVWYEGGTLAVLYDHLAELLGGVAYFAVFIIALVTFPYYWLKWFRSAIKVDRSSNDITVMIKAIGNRGDQIGLAASVVLIVIVVWVGTTYFRS